MIKISKKTEKGVYCIQLGPKKHDRTYLHNVQMESMEVLLCLIMHGQLSLQF